MLAGAGLDGNFVASEDALGICAEPGREGA